MKSFFEKFMQMKRHTTDWENIIAKHVSQKGIVCKIYTELYNSEVRQITYLNRLQHQEDKAD